MVVGVLIDSFDCDPFDKLRVNRTGMDYWGGKGEREYSEVISQKSEVRISRNEECFNGPADIKSWANR